MAAVDTTVGIDVRQAHHPIRWQDWVGWAVAVLLAAMFAYFLVTNPNLEWDVVFAWFNAPSIIKALWVTIGLAAVSMVLGTLLGVVLAVMKMSSNRLLSGLSSIYIWFFRGTPLLVQLIFWYNLAALTPTLGIGIPFGGPMLVEWRTNDVITPLTAAILGLALNEAAYMAEIIRGGLLSVDQGQREAAAAYGMTPGRALRRVVLPQAMRAIVPATGNQLITIVKATSQVSVIAMSDLLYTVQSVYNRTFQTIPLLLVAVLWYLIVTTVLNIVQSFIEYHYARGNNRDQHGLAHVVMSRVGKRTDEPAKPELAAAVEEATGEQR